MNPDPQTAMIPAHIPLPPERVLAEYTARAHAFVAEQTVRVTPTELQWGRTEADGFAAWGSVPLAEVRKVHLKYAPSRLQGRRCTAEVRHGQTGRLLLVSGHYLGYGRFQQRSEAYTTLVRCLCAGVAARSPGASFQRGWTWQTLAIGAGCGAVLLWFLIVALTPIYEAEPHHRGFIALLGLLVVLGPATVFEVKRNWPAHFDGRRVPVDLLPGAYVPPHGTPDRWREG